MGELIELYARFFGVTLQEAADALFLLGTVDNSITGADDAQ